MAEADARELKAWIAGETVAAVNRAAEDLLGRAQRDAPVEEGTLRASGTVELLVNGARFNSVGAAQAAAMAAAGAGGAVSIDAEVSFNTVYAARQHEELDWQHPKGGSAKYLERPLAEQAGRYEAVIAAAIRRATS